QVRVAGEERWIAIEDAARYRDGLGVQPPLGVPDAFLAPATQALDGLLARWARTHGPFLAPDPAARWGMPVAPIEDALERLHAAGTLLRGEFRPGGAEREWCDPDVLRLVRRRSLARLRREVEPVEQTALARFLPAWHGIAPIGQAPPAVSHSAALERLAEVVDQLAGVPIPASVLERDVLPARIPGYQPALLDELGAMGEVAWVGRGSLGRDDGRIVLHRPGRGVAPNAGAATLAGSERPSSDRHDRIREHLFRRGASFYREVYAAAGGGTDREVLDAMWDLVWSGEVTNDTFAPLRALRWKRPGRDAKRRPGRLTSLGPPEAAGRWSLVEPTSEGTSTTATERAHALANALLERHGVVTREAVIAEGIEGGFAAAYPVLRAMEEAGRIRRGYFVEGLGAAQFALAGALERLRTVRETEATAPVVHLLAATDPAQPYGAALSWPRRGDDDRRPFQRAAGAYVALVDGTAVAYLDRGGASLQLFPAADDPDLLRHAAAALGTLVADGRIRDLVIKRLDGEPVSSSVRREDLLESGFVPGYRGLTLRRS
ncbi:MAG TPA: DEAD/DEAH box helicase, partial [Candidatus Limnocylindria bacterium]|nr:DEAD/DEAH box helicase [Candidatus Limnocylindria bacterium]